ncbi:hypothetical protein AXG93_638s1210 [Marchantia polymorpha subsp. ruderalis]|uniref:Uncharacterized protein n=1 Tax=Marchantia polymorpha subsp. ruderalis TaxID=1480154 RepID=A0A176W638_MARPO|nr:hypothetical protein AXG93_638s1210 [Marchantia polymorpha subsp. ruderalis]
MTTSLFGLPGSRTAEAWSWLDKVNKERACSFTVVQYFRSGFYGGGVSTRANNAGTWLKVSRYKIQGENTIVRREFVRRLQQSPKVSRISAFHLLPGGGDGNNSALDRGAGIFVKLRVVHKLSLNGGEESTMDSRRRDEDNEVAG